jgi:hypothetical protein
MRNMLRKNDVMKKNYISRPAFSRDDVLTEAVEGCLDAMYRASYPSITLEELKEVARKIDKKERDAAKLYNRHYLPQRIHTAILEDFADAYQLKSQLPDIIEILKGYFKEPIVDKWIEGKGENDPGHRGYENPEPMPEEHRVVAEKYMDMANGFYNWNRGLNCLYFNVCNVSPCSNRETVEKWHHEHGEPDFKIPDDSWWVDGWDDEEEVDEEV